MTTSSLPHTTEALLAHHGWVRDLARRLVADPNLADDLEQETWAVALVRPPKDAHSPRGWLGAVLRSRLRDHFRGANRRSHRERVAARPEAQPSASDVASSADAQRVLLSAVMELHAPHRDVILLRYFEGLSPSEIADRLGMPSSSVRSRLQRALAELRERLDALHGGDGATWRHALVPLLSLPTSSALETPGALRRPRRGSVVAAAAAGILLLAALFVFPPRWFTATSGDGARSEEGARSNAVSVAETDAERERSRDRVRGGRPRVPTQRVRSGSMGGTPVDAGLAIAADEPATDVDAPIETTESAAASTTLTVRVRDPDGGSVGGVAVVIEGLGRSGNALIDAPRWNDIARGLTDASGTVRLSAESDVTVRARAEQGDLHGVSSTTVTRPGGADVEIVLGRAATLSGVVQDTDGNPVPGATVGLMTQRERPGGLEFFASETTDAEGRFAFAGVPTMHFEQPSMLQIVASGFAPRREVIRDGASAETHVEIVLSAGRVVTGRVLDADGRPLAEVLVQADRADMPTETDAEGSFQLAGVPPDASTLRLELEGYAPLALDLSGLPGAQTEVGDVVLTRGGTITGRVVDMSGTGVEAATVMVLSRPDGEYVQQGATDRDGRFEIHGLGDAAVDLEVYGPEDGDAGFTASLRAQQKDVRPGTDALVRLSGARTVLVRLIDDATGEALVTQSVAVRLTAEGAEFPSIAQSWDGDTTSRIRIRPPESGTYSVWVRVPGFAAATAEQIFVSDNSATEIDLRLTR